MGTLRLVIAYIVAPVALPVIELRLWEPRPFSYEMYLAPLYSGVGALGTLLFGIPIYLYLCKRKWTAFWIASIAGFIVGGLIWSLMQVVLILQFGTRYLEYRSSLDWLHEVVWPYGPLGAAVASLLWVLAWLERAKGQVN